MHCLIKRLTDTTFELDALTRTQRRDLFCLRIKTDTDFEKRSNADQYIVKAGIRTLAVFIRSNIDRFLVLRQDFSIKFYFLILNTGAQPGFC